MTSEPFGQDSWERRWAHALRESPEKVAMRRPNAVLLEEIGDLRPGLALDAGCGHGAEAIWLAASGWQVTAVDFSLGAALDSRGWDIVVAQERPRAAVGTGVDAVVRAVRLR